MENRRKKINIYEFIFKFLIVVCSFTGLFLNFKIAPMKSMILYFTILSNICVFLFYVIYCFLSLGGKLKKNKLYYIIKGLITVNITLTLAVYNLVLNGGELYLTHPIAGLFVHVITPILVILDYIIFGEKGNLNKKYPLYWIISLIAYVIICVIYALIGGKYPDGNSYPYFFMNIEKYGILMVLAFNIILAIVYLIFCYIILYFDKLMKKKRDDYNGK